MERPRNFIAIHVEVFTPEQDPNSDSPFLVGRPGWDANDPGLTLYDELSDTRTYIPADRIGVVRERPIDFNDQKQEDTKHCEVCRKAIANVSEASIDAFYLYGADMAPLWLACCRDDHGTHYFVYGDRLEEDRPRYCWAAHLAEKTDGNPAGFIDAVLRLHGVGGFDAVRWEEQERAIWRKVRHR